MTTGWNSNFSRKKQQEMVAEAIRKHEQSKSAYRNSSQQNNFYPNEFGRSLGEQRKKDRMFGIIGVIIISIVFVLGVTCVIWAVTA